MFAKLRFSRNSTAIVGPLHQPLHQIFIARSSHSMLDLQGWFVGRDGAALLDGPGVVPDLRCTVLFSL